LTAIREWANDPASSQVLWLTDVAGAGKSTIAKHLSDEWRDERRLGGCFFFDKNREDTRSTCRFCETVAYQLAASRPQLRSAILCGIKELNPPLPLSLFADKLQKMVINPLEDVNLIFVIDALDECDKDERGSLLQNLLPSLSQISIVKILITSRPESDLVQYLNIYQSKIDSLHDMALQSNQDDISRFVEHKLENLVQSSIITERDVKMFAKRVNCLFILASTACKAIQTFPDPHAMLETLLNPSSNVLTGINELYATILEKSFDFSQVQGHMASRARANIVQVLKAILAAYIPLDIATIDSILGIRTTRHIVKSLSSVLHLTEDGPIHILHPTFREFLEDKKICQGISCGYTGCS
jgi:hypothetical protein